MGDGEMAAVEEGGAAVRAEAAATGRGGAKTEGGEVRLSEAGMEAVWGEEEVGCAARRTRGGMGVVGGGGKGMERGRVRRAVRVVAGERGGRMR